MASKEKKKKILYKCVKKIVGWFYKKRDFSGTENLPDEPCIIVCNHSKTHGPLMSELYYPRKKYVWCIGQMMNVKEVPAYTFGDFWSNKPKYIRWLYKVLSYVIALPAAYIFGNADCIAVYKDMRIVSTYKDTVRGLNEGRDVIIFPEKHEPYNHIVNDFQERFADVARIYYQRYKKTVAFVPTYHAVKLKKVVFGKPVYYDPDMPIEEQRKFICDKMKEGITELAMNLPEHKVVPYENIKERDYVTNLNRSRERKNS